MVFSRLGVAALSLGIFCCAALGGAQELGGKPPFHDYTMPAQGSVTVPAEGGLVFQMKVNGQGPFATVFDTGAVNVVSAVFAQQLGLKIVEEPVSFGAIGGTIKAHTAHVDTMTIGDLVVRDQTFFVLDIPTGAPTILVGWELMQRFVVRMDFKHEALTFFDGPKFRYAGKGEAVPLRRHTNGNGIDVEAKIDGIPGTLLMDSGNQIGLYLMSGFVAKNNLVKALGARYKGYNGKGFGGDSPEAWYARLHTLSLGKIVVKEPVVRLQTADDSFNTQLAGNLGQNVLKHFTVTIDAMREVMYLEKIPGWDAKESFNRTGIVYDNVDGVDEVKTVFPGSPAEEAGLKAGDSVTAINGKVPADDPNDPVFEGPVGTVLHLTVRREDVMHVYDVTLRDVL